MCKRLITVFILFVYISCCNCEDINDTTTNATSKIIQLIYPGTLWCGPGNVSESYDQLGSAAEPDACCRQHDFCPDIIPAGETKHNLTNNAHYTRLSCKCDDMFRKCLKTVNSSQKTARAVGIIYFDFIFTKCFKKAHPIVKCLKKGGRFKHQCVHYELDENAPEKYQWFDVKEFDAPFN